MGGLVSGIYDLFAGDPTHSEEQAFKGLSGFENNLGEQDLGLGSNFYQDILSGDPSKIAEVLAPEIRTGQQQVEQQAKTNAEFGNRSGGTNASTQAAQSNERGNIINLIGGLQKGAADSLTNIGENSLNMGSNSLSKEADLAIGNQQRVANDVGGIASGVASIAAPFLGGGEAAAGDPYESIYNANHTENSDMGLNPQSEDLSGISV